jgi:hypothetical protein
VDQGGSGIKDPGPGDGHKGGTITVSEVCVYTPEIFGRRSLREGTVKARVSTEIPKKAMFLRQTYKGVGYSMILVVSIPPNVSSPFICNAEVVGSRERETKLFAIIVWLNRLSVTVGMTLVPLGLKVPRVKPLGPILQKRV